MGIYYRVCSEFGNKVFFDKKEADKAYEDLIHRAIPARLEVHKTEITTLREWKRKPL